MPVDGSKSRARASGPKVRTGCGTCKTRRVKCDEIKPTCYRCTRAGLVCAGYAAIEPRAKAGGRPCPARSVRASSTYRNIYPRALHESRVLLRESHHLSPKITHTSITGKDVCYFDLFRYRVAKDLSGHLYDHFWTRVVLCEATRHDCVQKAVLALGALSKAMFFESQASDVKSDTGLLAPKHPTAQHKSNQHHIAAFKYHSDAVSDFKSRLQAKDAQWSRLALVMTLLLLAFELMEGNLTAVDGIMKSGLLLLRDPFLMLESKSGEETRYDSLRSTHRDLEDIEHLLPLISLMSGYTFFCKSQHTMFQTPGSPMSSADLHPCPKSIGEIIVQWGNTFKLCILFVTRVTVHEPDRLDDVSSTEETQSCLLRCLRHWKDVLHDNQYGPANTKDQRLGLDLVFIQQIMCTILVSCCTDTTAMTYDSFGAEFLDIVDRCALFLQDRGKTPRIPFVFNGGNLASAISLVVAKCRHLKTRMRAVELFKRIPWREGSWDRQAIICNIGQAALEERERDKDGHIKATSRWVWSNTQWDHPSGYPLAEYTRSLPRDDGLPIRVEILHGKAQHGLERGETSIVMEEGQASMLFLRWFGS